MRPLACDRSRAWISLRLDDELSRFEHVLLGAHLALCRDCRRFSEDVSWQTNALRTASFEPLTAPVTIPSPRTWRWPALGISTGAVAASIFALAVGLRGAAPAQPQTPLSSTRPAERAAGPLSRQLTELAQDRIVRLQIGGSALRGDPHAP
jgi:Putative zinc-finger